ARQGLREQTRAHFVSAGNYSPMRAQRRASYFPICNGRSSAGPCHAAGFARTWDVPRFLMPSDPLPILSGERAQAFAERARHASEPFVDARALEGDLRQQVGGEVRFDRGSRALYATDGSSYRQVPIGVVIPRDNDDVLATLASCREHGAPVLSRGGGTSLA